jgi:hypothetical protein
MDQTGNLYFYDILLIIFFKFSEFSLILNIKYLMYVRLLVNYRLIHIKMGKKI